MKFDTKLITGILIGTVFGLYYHEALAVYLPILTIGMLVLLLRIAMSPCGFDGSITNPPEPFEKADGRLVGREEDNRGSDDEEAASCARRAFESRRVRMAID